jgi:hypothetical protein
MRRMLPDCVAGSVQHVRLQFRQGDVGFCSAEARPFAERKATIPAEAQASGEEHHLQAAER